MKRIARHIKYDIYGYINKDMDAFHAPGTKRYWPKQFGIWWWDKQPNHTGMERANRILAAGHWNDYADIEEGFMNNGKWTTLKEANMAFEAKKILKKMYPNLPKIKIDDLFTEEEFNTMRINFLEALIIDLKKDMGQMYKDKKIYKQEDFEWLMAEFREQKNKAEHDKKIAILEQHYLRENLAHPFMYNENKYLYELELQTPKDPR